MPDASVMLELCGLLKINVNELLTGEHIIMDNYKDIAEQNLVEMRKQEEKAYKVILSVIVFAIMELFDRLFIDWYWVGHTKAWIIPGTEDLRPYIPVKALVRK